MQLFRASRRLTIVALMTLAVVGCTAEAQRYIRFPDLAHPGPAAYQRAQAIQHDPYPLNDVGPEIVGGRPLSYQQPINEAERAHMGPRGRGVLQPLPPPGTPALAPPVVSSPFAVAPPQVAAPLSTAPAPIVTGPMPAPTAPIVTSPYPISPAAPGSPFPYQQRAPY